MVRPGLLNARRFPLVVYTGNEDFLKTVVKPGDAEAALLEDFAFVPEDPALDLLQGEPNPVTHVLKCMRERA